MNRYPPDPSPLTRKTPLRVLHRYRHTCGTVSALLNGENLERLVWCGGCRKYVPAKDCVEVK